MNSFEFPSDRLARRPLKPVLASSILALGAVSLVFAPRAASAAIVDSYNFGTAIPGVLTPTTFDPNVTATSISPDTGLQPLDLTSPATAPPSAPYLRTVFNAVTPTEAAAFANNSDFKFTVTANAGFAIGLQSLVFDAMRGGGSTPRGFAVRSSADNFSTVLLTADVPTVRPTFTNYVVDLSGAAFQNLSTITFKIYCYSPATGSSMDYDNFVLNGTTFSTGFTGYKWTGATNAFWDTTSSNWTLAGSIYPDATPASDVLFDDSSAVNAITVSPNSLSPHSVTFGNGTAAYTMGGSSLSVATSLTKSGDGATILNNAVSAGSVLASTGTLTVGPTGTLTSPNLTVAATGTLAVQAGGALGNTSGLVASGNVIFNNPNQTIGTLSGVSSGLITLNGTVLNVANASTYDGNITGTGSIVKNTNGTLILNGNTSNFTGGITIDSGAVQVGGTSAGFGAITVNPNGVLNIAGACSTPITLAGGTIGSAATNITAPANLTVTANSTVKTYNAATGLTSNDVIISGLLQGSGNINILTLNGNTPDSQAFRLRGGVSNYTGTITVNPSAKFELQVGTGVTSGSPMGTGTLVVMGGTTTTGANGTFSIVNLRNNSAAGGVVSDTNLGNNVQVSGFGTSFFNMLGSVGAGSAVRFGDLLIGDGQAVGAVSTGTAGMTLAFATVHLNGGNATFIPQPVGNTNFLQVENITLGTISENVPGSAITMNGAATLTLTGTNTYTGATTLSSGTTVLAAGASIATSSNINVAPGATLNTSALGTFTVPASQTLTVNGFHNGAISVSGTLRGGGNIFGTVTAGSGGYVKPGEGVGVLTANNLDLLAGSILEIDLSKLISGGMPLVGTDYDRVAVSDISGGLTPTVHLAGTLSLVVAGGVEQGDVFTIIMNSSLDPVAGTFNGLANGATFTAGGQLFQISYADDGDTSGFELTGGNDVSLLAVPEPGSVVLLLGGLAACAMRRRRK
jgi:autotransporter-associated beta strand protein